MAEAKSDEFTNNINGHSEKFAKFDPLSINRLERNSECNALTNVGFQQKSGRAADVASMSAYDRFC